MSIENTSRYLSKSQGDITVATKTLCFVTAGILLCGLSAGAQDKKESSGKIIGEIKAQEDTKDGKNTIIKVLAPGEEKPRAYFVNWDPKAQAPIEKVLKAVRAAKVGDRVQFDWTQTNHGPAITSFQVLKKANGGDHKN